MVTFYVTLRALDIDYIDVSFIFRNSLSGITPRSPQLKRAGMNDNLAGHSWYECFMCIHVC